MTPPYFYCERIFPDVVSLDESESRHALLSLRLRPSDPVVLFDGKGTVAQGHLETLPPSDSRTDRRARLPALVRVDRVERVSRPPHSLTLIVAACKGPRLEWMIEKCTELGVARVILAAFERSVVRPGSTHVEKLGRTALEACKQCGRVWLPSIEAGEVLSDALAARGSAPMITLHSDPAAPTLSELWRAGVPADVFAVIGPEGGYTEQELATLRAAGAVAQIASHTLRIETAAIATAAVWMEKVLLR